MRADAALQAYPDIQRAVPLVVLDDMFEEEVNAAVIMHEGIALGAQELMEFLGGNFTT